MLTFGLGEQEAVQQCPQGRGAEKVVGKRRTSALV